MLPSSSYEQHQEEGRPRDREVARNHCGRMAATLQEFVLVQSGPDVKYTSKERDSSRGSAFLMSCANLRHIIRENSGAALNVTFLAEMVSSPYVRRC